MLRYLLDIVERDAAGLRFDYRFPTGRWCWSPSCWSPRLSPPSGRRKRRFAARLWKLWNMNKHTLATVIVAAIALVSGRLEPLRAADSAQQIAEEAQRRTTTTSERYEGVLQSFDTSGKTAEKRWIFERSGSHGQSKTTIRFTAPSEVRGVALLILNRADRPSDQWMWTPALERDRRIALQDRSTRFFGTDFSFEDLEERDAAQYDHTLLGEEAIGDAKAWKIQGVPKPSRSSQYTKSIIWIRMDNYAAVRIESYVNNQVVRRLDYGKLQNIQGIWTARELKMADLRRGTATWLDIEKIEYNIPVKDSDFTVQALRRQ